MTSVTTNRVTAALNNAGFPVSMYKGMGYFYFIGNEDAPVGIEEYIPSIYSNHLRDMTIEEYVDHVADAIRVGY